MIQLLVMIAFYFIVKYLFKKSDEEGKEFRQLNNTSFNLPKEGGALQNLPKDSDKNIQLKLKDKTQLSRDSYQFRFEIPNSKMCMGLAVGQHAMFSAQIQTKDKPNGDLVQRKYTPVSAINQKGYVDFVIKIYRRDSHPSFPEGGVMSQYLENMQVGQSLLMSGPFGRILYQGYGKFLISKQVTMRNKIGLVASGTGITPCYQIIQAALAEKDDTELTLIYGSRTIGDILLKEQLDQFRNSNPTSFKLFYTIYDETPNPSWEGGKGFIDKQMLAQNLPKPSPDTIILYCGPPSFDKAILNHLQELGYDNTMIQKF
ncbi:nadh-cytochrome b5 reductase [Stylonychia lemnae]|uniref:NADH-cytochrome b5 reductase n=1 Tax=Stylonychia lemnae TaxID=5949 RepID=A0A078AZE2_STYLE|nr:nadh-cytochrome b5 reductase [Stylonychia lemnae]|eukprot:CDW86183.1 nadh-cytochrome b5 reductase [Stylonychia lemnae]